MKLQIAPSILAISIMGALLSGCVHPGHSYRSQYKEGFMFGGYGVTDRGADQYDVNFNFNMFTDPSDAMRSILLQSLMLANHNKKEYIAVHDQSIRIIPARWQFKIKLYDTLPTGESFYYHVDELSKDLEPWVKEQNLLARQVWEVCND